MSGPRTEKPTPRQLRDARLRGDVAVSRDLTSSAALGGGLVALALAGPSICSGLAACFRRALLAAPASGGAPGAALLSATLQLASAAVVPLATAAFAACACGALQTRGLFTSRAAAPRWSRVAPLAGFRRLSSSSQLALVALGLSRVLAIAAITWAYGDDLAAQAAALVRAPAAATLLAAIPAAVAPLALRILAALVGFAVVDLLLARSRHERSLRMTLDEVRREQKEQDGDPQHKAARRSAHRALANAAPASRATCVVVNPTHLAIALHHDLASDTAPTVIAKGSGDEARRIRLDALRAAVPIVKDVALARALFRLAEVGDEIPQELYDAAAAVLIHVHGLSLERRP